MDKNNTSGQITGGVKTVDSKSKSITPAVLGVANSHGVKFPANMTSEYKKELFSKLEEWRKARKEKLAASILAKQKQISVPPVPLKVKKPFTGDGSNFKRPTDNQDRQSVFERLYQNNTKKKPDVPMHCTKLQQTSRANFKKCAVLPSVNQTKSVKVLLIDREFETLPEVTNSDAADKKDTEIISQNIHNNSVYVIEITEEERNKILPASVVTETSNKEVKGRNCDQVNTADVKAVKKTDSGLMNVSKKVEAKKDGAVLRRSISMMFHQKCRAENAVRRCMSVKNLHEMNINVQRIDFKSLQKDNDKKEKVTKNKAVLQPVAFDTPKNTKSMTPIYLRSKLEDWLKVNGHSLDGYKHLCYFGLSNNGNAPVEIPAIPLKDLNEKSYYVTTPNTTAVDSEKENLTSPTVIQQVDVKDAENWLKELHRLIVELKYPLERCEEWLSAIKKKCPVCSQLPIYWECLAALHESKGDLKSAIEDYERAIIRGGEVDVVGDSLAQLFDKMVIDQKKHLKPRLEKGLDPKNIFKSTIIKFALQQKAIKKLSSEIEPGVREQLYVATPVRRSSRIQTPLKSSDEVASLQSLTPEFRKNVMFKPNQSLLE